MRVITALAAGVLVLGTACSDADAPPAGSGVRAEGDTGSSSASDQANGSTTRRIDPRRDGLELAFGEFAITLEADEIRPGPVTFVVRNGGELVHGFEIEIDEVDGHGGHGDNSGHGNGDDDGFKLEGEPFGPGETIRIATELAPGLYKIECFIEGHDDLGMETMLVVRARAPLIRPERRSRGNAVEIADFAFSPAEIEVEAGTEVTWSNADPAAHTVTAVDDAFDSGTLEPGSDFSTRFTQAGTFAYLCQIHPAMRGTVRVV